MGEECTAPRMQLRAASRMLKRQLTKPGGPVHPHTGQRPAEVVSNHACRTALQLISLP